MQQEPAQRAKSIWPWLAVIVLMLIAILGYRILSQSQFEIRIAHGVKDGGADQEAPANLDVANDELANNVAAPPEIENVDEQEEAGPPDLADGEHAPAELLEKPVEAPVPQRIAEPVIEDGWIILFRSDDPTAWNRETVAGEKFSTKVELDKDIDWLRFRRIDTGDDVIIPMTREGITKLVKVGPLIWNGTGSRRFALGLNSWKLGIANSDWRGDWSSGVPVFVATENESSDHVDGYGGWGFGQANRYRSNQHHTWAGQRVEKTIFEIAVKSGNLAVEERGRLLVTKSGQRRERLSQ